MSIIANLTEMEVKRFLQYMQYVIYISFIILFSFARKIEGRLEVELFDPNELGLLVNLLVAIISIRYIRNEMKFSELNHIDDSSCLFYNIFRFENGFRKFFYFNCWHIFFSLENR